MSKIESKTGRLKQTDVKIYNFLSDFNNFNNLIPADKVKNWKSTNDTCQFTVDGIGNVGLRIVEKTPNNLIKVQSEGQSPVNFLLWIQIKKISEDESAIKIVIEPKVNPFMLTVIKSPLQNFVDMMIDQLEKLHFD